ncbi:RNA polymerase sigma factor [uncultured Formosa sp.]|uniref:RNA polymerase sigma factor n=1 Tax=uncultured Formosa sp. TaxID=255435 RepID=UPI00262FC122|nr:RNA polymerase sigma factor [uncultured Formosa sp.]
MSPTNQHIDSLIELCKKGNQSAQLEVYNRYYHAMYNTAFRIVKNSFEAEDIMQDSFLTAFTKLESLKDIKTFGGWLKRIVVNNSIHHFNKNSKYEDVPYDTVMYKIEDTDVDINEDEESNAQAKYVLKMMNTLKDSYRIALTLHLIEGYDYEEMSSIMNVSYANCRTTISRAKESLRQKLQQVV